MAVPPGQASTVILMDSCRLRVEPTRFYLRKVRRTDREVVLGKYMQRKEQKAERIYYLPPNCPGLPGSFT